MTSHVSDGRLEDLALGKLPTLTSIRTQRHIYNCTPCLQRLVQITFALAARGLGSGPAITDGAHKGKPLFFVHDTADGFIYSRTEKRGSQWEAHHWGDQLAGGRICNTMREANEYLVNCFREMFPEHCCTRRCRLNPDQELDNAKSRL